MSEGESREGERGHTSTHMHGTHMHSQVHADTTQGNSANLLICHFQVVLGSPVIQGEGLVGPCSINTRYQLPSGIYVGP